MNSGRQAPHFSEGMLISASLLLPFFFFALSALQVGLPGLLATREGGPTLFAVLLAKSLRGDACMVALPLPRYYLPAANREEDLMPERGPVQLLLHFLRLRPAPGWKIGLAVALVCDARPAARRGKPLPEGEGGPRPVAPSSCLEPCTCRRARAEAMALGPFHSRRHVRGAAAWPERRRSMRRATPRSPSRSPSLHASRSGSMHATRIWRRTIAGSPRSRASRGWCRAVR